MGEFYINTRTITQQSKGLSDIKTAINSARGSVNSVKDGLDSIGLSILIPSVSVINKDLIREIKDIESLSTALAQTNRLYKTAESEILGLPVANNNIYELHSNFGTGKTIVENVFRRLVNFVLEDYEKIIRNVLIPIEFSKIISNYYKYKVENTYKEAESRIKFFHVEDNSGFKPFDKIKIGLYNLKPGEDDNWIAKKFGLPNKRKDSNYMWNDETKSMEKYDPKTKKTTKMSKIAELGRYDFFDKSKSTMIIEDDFDRGKIKGDGKITAGKREAKAGVYGGLYSYDADGNKSLALGVGAEAKTSASLLEADGEIRTGSNYLGSYIKGNVAFGKAEASAGADLGVFDSKGKLNPQFGASAKAEAKVVEVGGSKGSRIMGTDIGVSGKAGFGIGGHVDFGYSDSVLTIDAGAYLGPGASASLEIDFSETGEAIDEAKRVTSVVAKKSKPRVIGCMPMGSGIKPW